jgi:hypothetical protein
MLVGTLPFSSKSSSLVNLNDTEKSPDDKKNLFDKILNQQLYFPPDLSLKSKSILNQLLEKKVSKRLGSSIHDFDELRTHEFFNSIDWGKLVKKQLEPPFRPNVKSEIDTCYFETEFTGENVQFTPNESLCIDKNDQYYFDSFSFYGSKTSLNNQISQSNAIKVQTDKYCNIPAFNFPDMHDVNESKNKKNNTIAELNVFDSNHYTKEFKVYKAYENDFENLDLVSNAFPNIIRFTDSNGIILKSQTYNLSDTNSSNINESSASDSTFF